MDFVLPIVISVASTIIVSILSGFTVYFGKQAKTYKKLLEQQKEDNLRTTIHEELEPIVEEIHRLQDRIAKCEQKETHDMSVILGSYKFRLIYLCRIHIRQGYITQEDYDQLSEFYRTYRDLGGNGQAQEYYQRASELPIRNHPEK